MSFYCWFDSSHDNNTRQAAVTRLNLLLTPPETVRTGNKTRVNQVVKTSEDEASASVAHQCRSP